MGKEEYFDFSIDYNLFMRINASQCPKYASASKGNWTWMTFPLPEEFTDGKEHTLLFEFYLGSVEPFTVFAIDVIRFVTPTHVNDNVRDAGPCVDGGHPIISSEVDDGVCGWQPLTCCAETELGRNVRDVIESRKNATCNLMSACSNMLRTLSCLECAPINYANANATSGKHRICKDYAKHAFAACKNSKLSLNGRSCLKISTVFDDEAEFIDYFGGYVDGNDNCYSVDYTKILTPTEVEYINDVLKGSGGLSSGALAAIIVLCIVLVALIVVAVVLWFVIYRPRNHVHGNDTDRMHGGGGGGSSSGNKKKKGGDKGKDSMKRTKRESGIEMETTMTRTKKSTMTNKDESGTKKKSKKADEEESAGAPVKEKETKTVKDKNKDTKKKTKKTKNADNDNAYEEEISY